MRGLVILSGPTAAGKTELSIELAGRIGGEIISADSMQVYRGMDIGTAKIRESEMKGVRHHLIDCISPFGSWSAGVFKTEAQKAMEGIYDRGHLPIIVGGTGFYIQTVLYDVDFSLEEPHDPQIQTELERILESGGRSELHRMLKEVDPVYADEVHENNVKKVVRALEFYRMTGERMSEHNSREREKESAYNSAYFVVTMDRQRLYERIDRRVDIMLEKGLVDEVKGLREQGLTREHLSMQGLGYKEILACLEGECSLEEAVRILKRDTRHFAKRQLTWFKREKDVITLRAEDFKDREEMVGFMIGRLSEKGIISCR